MGASASVGVKIMLALLFLHMLLLGTAQLVVPLYALMLEASRVDLGIIVGAMGVGGMLLSVFSSALSNKVGRRTMVSASFVFWLGAGGVCLTAASYWSLVVVQVLIGLADLFLWVSGVTYLTEVAPTDRQAQVQSWSSGVMGLGIASGPAIAGWVGQTAGFGHVFAYLTVLAALGAVLSRHLPTIARPGVQRPFVREAVLCHMDAVKLLHDNRSARLAVLLTLLGTMSWMTVGPSFYIAYLDDLGLPVEVIGVLTTLRASAGTLARFSFAFCASYVGSTVATFLGFGIGGLALASTPLLTGGPVLGAVGCLGEAADRLRLPGIQTMMAECSDQNSRALSFALINLSWAIGVALISPALGVIGDRLSLSAALLVPGSIVVLSTILLYSWNRSTQAEITSDR